MSGVYVYVCSRIKLNYTQYLMLLLCLMYCG